jgi:nucleotide-binding universal stress UspA family protein
MDAVLVGDDGSDDAEIAIRWASHFAVERDAQLFAVNVTTDGVEAAPARVAQTVVRRGHPAAAILEAANDANASVIVLGRRGRSGFSGAPLGGVAYHVAAVSDRPVVVVPSASPTGTPPLVHEIVMGVDGMPESNDAARWATQNFASAHFTAVHALELAPAFAQMDAGPQSDDLYAAARARTEEFMRDRWVRPLVDADVSFDTIIEEGGAVEVLLESATRIPADLVVVSRRDRHLRRGTLGGVSSRVLAYAPCAAAMVPSLA